MTVKKPASDDSASKKPPTLAELRERKNTQDDNVVALGSDPNFDGDVIPGSDVQDIKEGVDKETPVNPDGVTFSGDGNPIDKTPADLASESPAATAKRFGISSEVPQHLHDNPNVVANKDMGNFQIPGGTHLHPDVARDNFNRNVGGHTERGEVSTTTTQAVYATENPNDDKGRKDAVNLRDDRNYPEGAEEPPYSDGFADENPDDDKNRKDVK